MPLPARITMLCEGDAESSDAAFSGSAKSLLEHLRARGHQVTPVDCELRGIRRLATAARCYTTDKQVWRVRYRLGRGAFLARTEQARRGLNGRGGNDTDVILQVGATFQPPLRGQVPYALYCDWNMRVAMRFAKTGQSPALHLSSRDASAVDSREGAIYRGAAAIFTISEWLRRSFVEEYGVRADRVMVVRAGPNLDLSRIPSPAPERDAARPPTILFVGKEFERKGGDLLLRAFRSVREHIPEARLVIVGPRDLALDEPGVEVVGLLRKSVPAELDRLLHIYASADVFCLPTRYEPLGLATVEAMYFGLPCVVSTFPTLAEVVEDGVTGYAVPVDKFDKSTTMLAERLRALLADPALARQMGEAGRVRAQERFTWEGTARRIGERLDTLIGHS